MSNSYRLDFNPAQVIAALARRNPVLWRKLSASSRSKVDIITILRTVRNHELSIKSDLQEAEIAIQHGEDWKEYLRGGERCSLECGYQGWVTKVYINSWI